MEQKIVIVFDPITRTISIVENDFSTFEAFGILEATKQMLSDSWINND